jgi:hypothetical protein
MGFTDALTFIVETPLIFVSVNDAAFGNVVRRHFDLYRITDKYLDVMHSDLSGNGASNDKTVGKFYLKSRVA